MMLILLCRVYDYKLRSGMQAAIVGLQPSWFSSQHTEDLLELTNEDTVLALATVIGVLEEVNLLVFVNNYGWLHMSKGYSYVSQIKQRRAPQEGQKAQWYVEILVGVT